MRGGTATPAADRSSSGKTSMFRMNFLRIERR
jgi:hypothetical protein